MGDIERRLAGLGLELPAPLAPVGTYQAVKIHAGLGYVAGHAPMDGGKVLISGLIGADLSADDGYRAARVTALSMLASLKQALGDLDRVRRGSGPSATSTASRGSTATQTY